MQPGRRVARPRSVAQRLHHHRAEIAKRTVGRQLGAVPRRARRRHNRRPQPNAADLGGQLGHLGRAPETPVILLEAPHGGMEAVKVTQAVGRSQRRGTGGDQGQSGPSRGRPDVRSIGSGAAPPR